MNFSESLKKNQDFQSVYRKGRSYANKLLVMYVLENNMERNRLGISVSKKVGNSVVRHHVTRLVRESYRPVSYTHLDVYKRQLLVSSLAFLAASLARCARMDSVSYTHLDVYKRQV